MSMLKYFFSKKYREKTKRNFSFKITDKINAYDRDIELIYKEILRNHNMATK